MESQAPYTSPASILLSSPNKLALRACHPVSPMVATDSNVYEIEHRLMRRCFLYDWPMLPPFTTSVWPVMKDAIGDARKSAAWAISSGSPLRPRGFEADS
jgi:hypothetical protein